MNRIGHHRSCGLAKITSDRLRICNQCGCDIQATEEHEKKKKQEEEERELAKKKEGHHG